MNIDNGSGRFVVVDVEPAPDGLVRLREIDRGHEISFYEEAFHQFDCAPTIGDVFRVNWRFEPSSEPRLANAVAGQLSLLAIESVPPETRRRRSGLFRPR